MLDTILPRMSRALDACAPRLSREDTSSFHHEMTKENPMIKASGYRGVAGFATFSAMEE
jgi:hypothetical protein